jgi:polar amino acid transport system permease protein
MDTVWRNRELLWIGLQYTIKLFGVILVLGTAIGIVGGLSLLYGNRPLRWLFRFYVDIIRGMPLIVTIFIIYYGPVSYGINLEPFQSISVALSIFTGAHMSEIVRGAIQSVPLAQTEAAKALGLTFWQRFRSILLPQAMPMIMPPWTNLAVEALKGTSLAVLVSSNDLLFSVQKIAIRTGEYVNLYIAGLILYLIGAFLISRIGALVGSRFTYGVRA